jgi:hypothetical protein
MMSECHCLGIKNFKCIRHPGQIKLAFDLCIDDVSAPRYISSKGDDYNQKIDTSDFDYFTIKKSTNDWPTKHQYSKILMNFVISTLYWIFRVLWIILKYAIRVIWCFFKIFRCIIFRVLTESKRYRSKALLCHPVRCYHHHCI